MVSSAKELTISLEETWVKMILPSQCKIGVKWSRVLAVVNSVYKSSQMERLGDEFLEKGHLNCVM